MRIITLSLLILLSPLLVTAATISGTITDGDGNPVTETVMVSVRPYMENYIENMVYTSDGTYEITDINSGYYWFQAAAVDEDTWLYAQYYPGSHNPYEIEGIYLDPGAVRDDIDFVLYEGGCITGTVTGDGEPIQNCSVLAVLWEEDYPPVVYAYVDTDENGEYRLVVAPDDPFYLVFHPGDESEYVEEWYEDSYDLFDATMVQVGVQQTVTIDAELERGVSFYGYALDIDGSPMLPDDPVEIEIVSTYGNDRWEGLQLDEDGRWELLSVIHPGLYTMRFDCWSRQDIFGIFLGGVIHSWEAEWVMMMSEGGNYGPFIIQFEEGGTLTGSVTTPGGTPISEAEVVLLHEGDSVEGFYVTEDGNYTESGIAPASYHIMFRDQEGFDPEFPGSWFPTMYSGNAFVYSDALLVEVEAGEETVASMRIDNGGLLHLTVTGPGGTPYNPMEQNIIIYPLTYSLQRVPYWDEPGTNDDSPMFEPEVAIVLPPGDYKLAALPVFIPMNPDATPPPVQRTWYGGSFSFSDGDTFTITSGEVTEITIEMIEDGHTVSGQVTGQYGDLPYTPLIFVTDNMDNLVSAYVEMGGNTTGGSYSIPGIPDGSYSMFSMLNDSEGIYVPTWYGDFPEPGMNMQNFATPEGADLFSMEGADLDNMDIEMQSIAEVIHTPEPDDAALLDGYSLEDIYPNPFNDVAIVRFTVPERQAVKICVFNVLGRRVATLTNRVYGAGTYELLLENHRMASGLYFVQMEAGAFRATKRAVFLK